MAEEQNNTGIEHVRAFLRGEVIAVHAAVVRIVLRRYPLRSASRRGFVVVIADWLVRVAENATGAWTVQLLPQSPDVARELCHVHELRAVTLPDGWDVLECPSCGMEW